jgi:hypothetical protein
MSKVTYNPGEGDPHTTRCHGIMFRANVPVEISPDKKVEQLVSVLVPDAPDDRRKSVLRQMPLVDLLAGNPQFRVEGRDQAKRVAPSRRIESADDYEAHAIAWIRRIDDAAALDAQWDTEQELRDELHLPDGVIEKIATAFELRRAVVKRMRARAMPPAQQNGQQRAAAR